MNNKHISEEDWIEIRKKHAAMTPEEARAWIRQVVGPARRILVDVERDEMLTFIKLSGKKPFKTNNNQHTFSEDYAINGKIYHVTYIDNTIEVDEILED